MGTKLEITCQYCGNKKYFKACEVTRGNHKYCSRTCYNLSRPGPNPTFCMDCGKEINYKSKRCNYCNTHNTDIVEKRANSNRGKKRSQETKDKISKANGGENSHFFGTKHTDEWKKLASLRNAGESNPRFGKQGLRGKDNPLWKGGIKNLRKAIGLTDKYNGWRLSIFERDLFTCVNCGASGIYLECHHIKSVSDIIQEYNIKSVEDALFCNLLWDNNNAVTLCEACHCLLDKHRNRFGILRKRKEI